MRTNLMWAASACAILVVSVETARADGLPYRVRTRVDKANGALGNAENQLKKGRADRAQSYLATAKAELVAIRTNHAGTYDESDAEMVALVERITAFEKRLSGGGGGSGGEPKPEGGVGAGGAASSAPLPSNVLRHIAKIEKALAGADQALSSQNLKGAESALSDAARHRENLDAWFAGKFDPSHAKVRAVDQRLAAIRSRTGGLTDRSAGVAAVLPGMIDSLSGAAKRLKDAWSPLRLALISEPPTASEILALIDQVRVELPPAQAAAARFREQFPDSETLRRLSRRGDEALEHCGTIEYVASGYTKTIDRYGSKAVAKVEEVVQGAAAYGALVEKDPQLKATLAANLDQLAGGAEPWLDFLAILYPLADSLTDEHSSSQKLMAETVAELTGQVAKIRVYAAHLRKEKADADRLALERARIPTSEFRGPAWQKVADDCAQAYLSGDLEAGKTRDLLRIVIRSPWDERFESVWVNNVFGHPEHGGRQVEGTYRYVSAWLCTRMKKSGHCMVYGMTFRRTRQPDGSFSPLEFYKIGTIYRMLEENVNR